MICAKGNWRVVGGDQIAPDLYTRIYCLCDCGCEQMLVEKHERCKERPGYYTTKPFMNREDALSYIKWEQAKQRVNKI